MFSCLSTRPPYQHRCADTGWRDASWRDTGWRDAGWRDAGWRGRHRWRHCQRKARPWICPRNGTGRKNREGRGIRGRAADESCWIRPHTDRWGGRGRGGNWDGNSPLIVPSQQGSDVALLHYHMDLPCCDQGSMCRGLRGLHGQRELLLLRRSLREGAAPVHGRGRGNHRRGRGDGFFLHSD